MAASFVEHARGNDPGSLDMLEDSLHLADAYDAPPTPTLEHRLAMDMRLHTGSIATELARNGDLADQVRARNLISLLLEQQDSSAALLRAMQLNRAASLLDFDRHYADERSSWLVRPVDEEQMRQALDVISQCVDAIQRQQLWFWR